MGDYMDDLGGSQGETLPSSGWRDFQRLSCLVFAVLLLEVFVGMKCVKLVSSYDG